VRAVTFALALLLALGACAPKLHPIDLIKIEPQLTPYHLIADDGAVLPIRTWLPDGPPQAVILALHGFNDYSKAFEKPAEVWQKAGIATYAYDQRGFGEAPYHGRWAGADRMERDAGIAIRLLRERYPMTPLFLLGESMGGALALDLAVRKQPAALTGLILVAPAVRGRESLGSIASASLWLAGHTVPWFELTGEGLNIRPSDNIQVLRELFKDPLVIKGTRVDAIYGLVDLMDAAVASAPHLTMPTLVLYGAHEEVVSMHAARSFLDSLPKAPNIKIAIYPYGYHMLLRDREADPVIGDVAAWTKAPDQPLPSGADRRSVTALLPR
jgi:acylglycerol lipase